MKSGWWSVVVAASCALAGCLTDPNPPTTWPPDDFEIRVAGMQPQEDGSWIWQRFRVAADGTAVYREASVAVEGTSLDLPVFDTVSMYEIRPESRRILARLLHRAGVFENLEPGQEVNRREADPHVVVCWTAFGNTGRLGSFMDTSGRLDRVVHIVNSFMPEGRAFSYPELSGEFETQRLSRVPEALSWIDGAIMCHQKLLADHPEDPELPVDLFALAYVAGNVDIAREMVDVVAARGPVSSELLMFVDWQSDCLGPMRELLVRLEGG